MHPKLYIISFIRGVWVVTLMLFQKNDEQYGIFPSHMKSL